MLLLQVDLGRAATTDFLTDLGRLTSFFFFFNLNSASLKSIFVIPNRKYCGKTGFLSDGGECHVCEGHGRTGFRCSHWDHISTVRPAKEFHQHQVHLHVGSRKWVGKYIYSYIQEQLNKDSCMHDVICDAEKWSRVQSRLSATSTLSPGTTPWGWKLGSTWLNLHLYPMTSTPGMSKCWVCR